ncbi:TetR family transcriptional regulator [Streptomyces sp. URMC 127]|uniref:TetR/AcrR family transcriptional regulator n=1 Tax=Streptomyces sp. URMC 127 TaxID=3423402 RepID=UPI003F1D2991
MEFQRARSAEQRLERRRQILSTAAVMLTEMPVAKLSLNELSRRTGLAKSNVLRYFESREAVLLELLLSEMRNWIAEVERATGPGDGTPRERGDRLAEILAASLARRPVLCDLLAAQAAVLEHNISTEVAVRHKHAAWQNTQALIELVRRHLPELGTEGAAQLVETTVLTAMAAWPCSHPPEALQAAYDSDPALGALRMDFTDLVRRTAQVTASGLLARHETASARPA